MADIEQLAWQKIWEASPDFRRNYYQLIEKGYSHVRAGELMKKDRAALFDTYRGIVLKDLKTQELAEQRKLQPYVPPTPIQKPPPNLLADFTVRTTRNRCAHCGNPNPQSEYGTPHFRYCNEDCFFQASLPVNQTFFSEACNNNYSIPDAAEYAKQQSAALLMQRLEQEEQLIRNEEQRKLDEEQRRLDEKERLMREREDAKLQLFREKEEAKARLLREKQEALTAATAAEEAAFNDLIAPKRIPDALRFEHTHILGPSGSGKTTLLTDIILKDLWDGRKLLDPPAYIIIDPKGDLFDRLSNLAVFAPGQSLADRLVIVDPLDHPALNVFQATGRNSAQIISNFSYIFSTTRQQLTGKQDTCFGFCVSLLFKMQGSTLFTLLDLLEDRTAKEKADPRFAQAISNLTSHSEMAMRRFFQGDFYTQSYAATRAEIKTRIWEVLKDEHLFAMLNAAERKLDIADCIRQRKIVLVNTRMATLKLGHQTLGRYILSLAVDALQNRADIPKSEWHPTYIVMDEFQEFADEHKTPEMLRLIRAYNGGAILAHHNMYPSEFNDAIRSAISTNTGIKYASKPAALDINYMARDMQCDSDFLTRTCVKTDTHARFGCYFTGLQHPFVYEIPFDAIDRWPKMTEGQYMRMLARNSNMLEAPPTPVQPPLPVSTPTPAISRQPPAPARATTAGSQQPPANDPDAGGHTDVANKWGQ